MQQITDKYRKVNIPPVQEATVEFFPAKEAFPQFGLFCSVDAHNCEAVDIPNTPLKQIRQSLPSSQSSIMVIIVPEEAVK